MLFTSTGIKVELEPEILQAYNASELEIRVYKSNMLGSKVPFTSVDVRFTVEEGSNLVEIISESSDGNAMIRSKGIEGEAIVGIYSLKSGLQLSRLMIKIMPRSTAINDLRYRSVNC